MERVELIELGVQEITSLEAIEIEGGKVPLWYYFVAPGTAYIMEKFEKGCNCDVF